MQKDLSFAALSYLQEHYVVVADTLEKLSLLQNELFDFIDLDPPFPESEFSHATYNDFLNTLCSEAFRLAKPNSFVVLWQKPQDFLFAQASLEYTGWRTCHIPFLWTWFGSSTLSSTSTQLTNSYAMALYAYKGSPKLSLNNNSNVFVYPEVPVMKKIHADEKPLNLMKEILATFCSPGSMILSPFLGSGVTLLAAATLHMHAMGFDNVQENKDNFVKKLVNGWNSYIKES